jgi:hypothetical protein
LDEGTIVWDADAGRPDIIFRDGTSHGGLHCGDTLDVMIGDKWRRARIEYRHSTDSWYRVAICDDLLWLAARV